MEKRLFPLKVLQEKYGHAQESSNVHALSKTNNMLHVYVKRGSMEDAFHVFNTMLERDVVSWNIMILGYAKQQNGKQALELYVQMQQGGLPPSERTFVAALKACSSLAALEQGERVEGKFANNGCLAKGRTIHLQSVKSGFDSDLFVGTALVNMYAKCGSIEDARRVFEKLPNHNVVTWTNMILGYAEQEDSARALELYARMHQVGFIADHRAFLGALKACSSLAVLERCKQATGKFVKSDCLGKGRAIHSQVVQSGLSDVFLGNILVDMYVKSGSVDDARCVFDKLTHRTVVTWNTMILGYAQQEESSKAFRLYAQMQEHGLLPSNVTFVAILKACGTTAALETGKELHFQISRVGFETVANVATSLIDMYARCGSMDDAQQMFDALPTSDVVRWSALIAGYAHRGESELVFYSFERMRHEGIQPDPVTFLIVLTVCSYEGLVDKGQKYFQAMSKQYGIIPSIEHYTCMVDLLSRAGQVDEAVMMVEKMPVQPNAVIWLTMLSACRKWKNVQVGRHAFENITKLDKKLPAAYVLMANIYADSHMWEDCGKIQALR